MSTASMIGVWAASVVPTPSSTRINKTQLHQSSNHFPSLPPRFQQFPHTIKSIINPTLFSSSHLSDLTIINTPPHSRPFEQQPHLSSTTTHHRPLILFCALLCLPASLLVYSGVSLAAAEDSSIRASGIGLKVAAALRRSGWPGEAIVFTLATLPVLELRGAIPVGYWLHLDPFLLTLLSILGNMVPVPFILLYLKRFAGFLSQRSASATRFLDLLFQNAREKAGPVEEFRWLGLMLFVAVPFPGTGAWTGAVIASLLDMPFWSAVSANFFGVVLAGLLVNLLVNLGLKYAVATGVLLFAVSTVIWGVLRQLKKSLSSK